MSSLWLSLASQVPCVACSQIGYESPSVVHHMRFNDLGKRKSDRLVIALCPEHHVGKYSIHKDRERFERQFGSEVDLHEMTLAGIERLLKQRGVKVV